MPELRNLDPRTRRPKWQIATAVAVLAIIVILLSELWETPPGGEGLLQVAPNPSSVMPRETGEDGETPAGLTGLGEIKSGGYTARLYRYRDGRNVCYLAWERGSGIAQYCLTEDPPPE